MDLIKDLLLYFRSRKKFWLAPLILVLLLVGLLIIAGSGSAGAFIYSIF